MVHVRRVERRDGVRQHRQPRVPDERHRAAVELTRAPLAAGDVEHHQTRAALRDPRERQPTSVGRPRRRPIERRYAAQDLVDAAALGIDQERAAHAHVAGALSAMHRESPAVGRPRPEERRAVRDRARHARAVEVDDLERQRVAALHEDRDPCAVRRPVGVDRRCVAERDDFLRNDAARVDEIHEVLIAAAARQRQDAMAVAAGGGPAVAEAFRRTAGHRLFPRPGEPRRRGAAALPAVERAIGAGIDEPHPRSARDCSAPPQSGRAGLLDSPVREPRSLDSRAARWFESPCATSSVSARSPGKRTSTRSASCAVRRCCASSRRPRRAHRPMPVSIRRTTRAPAHSG